MKPKPEDLIAECRSKMMYALAMLEFSDEKKRVLDEREIRFALKGLRGAVEVLDVLTGHFADEGRSGPV